MSHFYLPNATPCHGSVQNARAKGAYVSVSTALDIIKKDALIEYQTTQALKYSKLIEQNPGEDDRDYTRRCIRAAQSANNLITDFGTRIHQAIDTLHRRILAHEPVCAEHICQNLNDPNILPWLQQYQHWFHHTVQTIVFSEHIAVSHAHQYAGTVDLVALLTNGNIAVLDFKTQRCKPHPTHPDQFCPPTAYDSWLLQLAAYKLAIKEHNSLNATQLISVVINSHSPQPPVTLPWPEHAYDSATSTFLNILNAWKWTNHYPPYTKIEPRPVPLTEPACTLNSAELLTPAIL